MSGHGIYAGRCSSFCSSSLPILEIKSKTPLACGEALAAASLCEDEPLRLPPPGTAALPLAAKAVPLGAAPALPLTLPLALRFTLPLPSEEAYALPVSQNVALRAPHALPSADAPLLAVAIRAAVGAPVPLLRGEALSSRALA